MVLTSRNPKVDTRWETKMKARDAVVRIYPNDVTSRESVRLVHKQICDELPPIGGVAQGAMVLADAMFVDMSLERVKKVVEPKVKGAIHLEELFSNTTLEFFVFFSSMAYVTGNQGQSIYAAGNAYMAALAAQRRKRGLAGSVINIGVIVGNGYVTRQLTDAQREHLAHMGNVFMSEQDFHQTFAEAVVAGRPGSNDIPEIMTGLSLAPADDADEYTWFHNPKFSHCVVFPENQDATAGMLKQNVTVKSQLLLATTVEEVKEAIQSKLDVLAQGDIYTNLSIDGFAAKLKSTLQIDDSVSIPSMNAEQLGLDSLVAVDIRSWFVKELNVEMPVLKILGGYTMAELISTAHEQLSESFTPHLGRENDPQLKAARANQVIIETAPTPIADIETNFTTYEEEDNLSDSSVSIIDFDQSREQPLETASKLKEVDFQNDIEVSPKMSSSSSSFDSDSESQSLWKSRISTATSASVVDDYSTGKDDLVLERAVPMSFGQARFWFLKFYLEDQTTFNITTSIRLSGHLNVENFRRAVKAVGKRHEGLRTCFLWIKTTIRCKAFFANLYLSWNMSVPHPRKMLRSSMQRSRIIDMISAVERL